MTTQQSNIEKNLKHLMRHEAKPNPKPLPYTQITRGFESVAFPKIVHELKVDDLVVKQKSLLAARELLGTGTSYVQCIAQGITPAVVALLHDSDAIVRERAAGTLECIAVREVGARDIIQHGGIPALVERLEDPRPKVRDASYKALIEAARFNCTRSALVELQSALPRILGLVLGEEEPRALQGLMLLNACVQVRSNNEALQQMVDKAAAIPSLAKLISADQSALIQEQAALLLGIVASNFNDAKLEAVQVGCVPMLLALLQQQGNVLLATAAANALMMITVVRDGKYAVIHTEGGLKALVGWLIPEQEQLCVNISQTICNVAEAPESRPILKECGAMEKLLSIHDCTQYPEIVRRGAAEALRQCKFKFRPFEPLEGRTVNPDDFPAT